jgi:SAM-dependent methyltransferase
MSTTVAKLVQGRVLKCGMCDVRSIDTLPSSEQLSAAYQNFDAGEIARDQFEAYVGMSKAILNRDLELLGIPVNATTSFLDYGCGGGHFVKAAVELGIDAEGIDLDAEDAKFGALHGLRIELGSYDDLAMRFGDKLYDVIQMMHVLEHVPHPSQALHALSARLKPNGALIIRVPDQDSFPSVLKIALRSVGVRSNAYGFIQPPIHLHGFTEASFRVLANQLGLDIVRLSKTSALDSAEFPTTARYWRHLGAQKAAYRIGAAIGSGGYLTAILRKKVAA